MTKKTAEAWGDEEKIDRNKVVKLNDQLRQTFEGGKIILTSGIAALRAETRFKILTAIQLFDNFTPDNDPYGEHDFGSVRVDGTSAFWKIDYYDQSFTRLSPAYDNPAVTQRVMTIMLAEEY